MLAIAATLCARHPLCRSVQRSRALRARCARAARGCGRGARRSRSRQVFDDARGRAGARPRARDRGAGRSRDVAATPADRTGRGRSRHDHPAAPRRRLHGAGDAEQSARSPRARTSRHVEDDATVVPFGVSAQASFGISRAREDLPELDGRGMVAAVIDSGMDATMPDLADGKIARVQGPRQRARPTRTTTSATAASCRDPRGQRRERPGGARRRPRGQARRGQGHRSQSPELARAVAQGIEWAVENRERYGIDVINLSIGDPAGCGDGTDVASQGRRRRRRGWDRGRGGRGQRGPATCTVKSPAAAESALTVGAMADPGPAGSRRPGSRAAARRRTAASSPTSRRRVSMSPMPGPDGDADQRQRDERRRAVRGRHGAADAAGNPLLTPAEVKDAIERTAVDWGAPGRDNDYGSGRLDAYAALAGRRRGARRRRPPVPGHRAWSGVAERRAVGRRTTSTSPAAASRSR